MLKLSDDLKLPVDAATQTFAFIARKGAGKTYTAGKLVELLLDANVQVVVLDTVGNWYGLRLSADGKSAGFDVPVLGGLRGDIPLEATGGALIADIVVETGRSLVIDVSQFSLADRKRFATSLGERLWQRKKGERHPVPLHLVIEESQLIVPQDVRGDSAKMVGIYEEIIRLGRNYGIGVSMITQRPQSVNKEVLNQTECLFVGQVNGAQERAALAKWIMHQGMDVKLVDELPSLKIGTFYVWSPQWLNILKKVQILPKRTYDASATPKVGDKRVQRDLKPLDLSELQERLKATIEKAKADDPKELRRQIAELKKAKPALIDQEAVDRAVATAVKENDRQWEKAIRERESIIGGLKGRLGKIHELAHVNGEAVPHVVPPKAAPAPVVRKPEPRRATPSPTGDVSLGKCERAILQVLSQFPEGCEAGKLTLLAGYRLSGGFRNSLSALRTAGLIEGENTGTMAITDAGLEIGPFAALPTGQALVDYWLNHRSFGKCEKAILAALIDQPDGLTAEELCEATGYQLSGGFRNALSALRTAGVIEGRNTERMTATSDLLV